MKNTSKHLKKRFTTAVIALLVAFLAAGTATFAWYIYNTNAHTTTVSMAAGTAASLVISNTKSGEYSYAIPLAESKGELVPVSTDKISNGFQHVVQSEIRSSTPSWVATKFSNSNEDEHEYYKHSLYLKSTGDDLNVYISDIGFEDSDENKPISTAIRVGFVVYKPGKDTGLKEDVEGEYIFEINQEQAPEREYNTATGSEGHVLKSDPFDNTTVPFTPKSKKNYCSINPETGEIITTGDTLKITTCNKDNPTRVDVYVWLEGCDGDCTRALRATTLKEVAIKFAGEPTTTNE